MLKNQIRIIGGEWRSRQISFYDVPGLRPTPDRVRVTLFNWLQFDIAGKRCLDLFAGSGALGFEAASRGAKTVVQVEQDSQACRALHENTVKLAARQIEIIQHDVFRFLALKPDAPFDIVFLDPPFGKNLAAQTCHWLQDNGWLNTSAKIYVEVEENYQFLHEMPVNWRLSKDKTAGEIRYLLYEKA